MTDKFFRLAICVFLFSCNNQNANTHDDHASHKASSHATDIGRNYCDSVNSGLIANDTLKGSPHRTAMATVNGNHIHIEYNSPGVKGRTIWGGLVPYDKVWATGAHMASNIQFSKDVQFNGQTIPAGKYGIFTIPGRDKWIFILNTRHNQHLADDYDAQEDVLRMELTPEAHEMTQRLTYKVEKASDTTGSIQILWEKVSISAPFTSI